MVKMKTGYTSTVKEGIMKQKFNYLIRHFSYQVQNFKFHNLTPLLMYFICGLFLVIGVLTLTNVEAVRYLYLVIGLMTRYRYLTASTFVSVRTPITKNRPQMKYINRGVRL